MIYDQKVRIQRVNSQSFYLIDNSKEDNVFVFQISGSTANLYTVKINPDGTDLSNLITCNCPDSTSWAQTAGVKCKHCCFVLIKILGLNSDQILDDGVYFSNPAYYNRKIIAACQHLVVKQELINESYRRKYQELQNQIKINGNGSGGNKDREDRNKGGQEPKDKFSITKDIREELDCPICFDLLKIKDSNQCPTCRNIVHTKCIKKWLSLGNKSCVYCRSDWSEFLKPKKSKPKKKITITTYLNLEG